MGQHGVDVDHDRAVALLEPRQRDADQFRGRKEIHVHDTAQSLGRGFIEAPHRPAAGVVDQQVEAAKLFANPIDGRLPQFRIGNVAGQRFNLAACSSK